MHDIRRVYAMLSITGGVDVSSVQHALGHATPEFTLRVYAYVNNDTNRAAAKKMQTAFESLSSAPTDAASQIVSQSS